ncbi:MAG: GNAT family N-acetyltransferase, partial [Desulfobacterales bacterium]|nr:GNAT family N-acetyltransferase [Desulfobacterales bacterium]
MIRKADIKDVKSIHGLLLEYGKKEELLARPLSELYDHIRDFSVYMDERNNQLIGCCALQFCWEDLAEIRSLAVLPEHLGKNIGSKLAETVLQEAKSFNVKNVFTLTYKP